MRPVKTACLVTLVVGVLATSAAPAIAGGPGDHGGANVTLSNGQTISGMWTNIGTFTIPAGVTVHVGGDVEIQARHLLIAGALNGNGRGFGGSPGGGGGGGGGTNTGLGGAGGGAGAGGGQGGVGACWGTYGTGGAAGPTVHPLGSFTGTPGAGGGGSGQPGSPGGPGGYRTVGGNGDTTTDESVLAGSGGGGGGGGAGGSSCNNCCGWESGAGGGGGGAGGRGGARIALKAQESLRVSGSISAVGAQDGGNGSPGIADEGGWSHGGQGGSNGGGGSGAPGAGGWFGNACCGGVGAGCGQCGNPGGAGGRGGPGAGGGVLLKSSGPTFELTGTIDVRGGGGSVTNGGTVKLFGIRGYLPASLGMDPSHAGRILAGRILVSEAWPDGSRLLTEWRPDRPLTRWAQSRWQWWVADQRDGTQALGLTVRRHTTTLSAASLRGRLASAWAAAHNTVMAPVHRTQIAWRDESRLACPVQRQFQRGFWAASWGDRLAWLLGGRPAWAEARPPSGAPSAP